MSIQLPFLALVPSWVLGGEWPDADEDKMWQMGDAWSAESTTLSDSVQSITGQVNALLANYEGPAADALRAFWAPRAADIQEMATVCDELSQLCNGTALQVQYTKLAIIANLVILAVTIASLIAAAFATFGASLGGIPVAETATSVVVRELIKELLIQIVKGAVRGFVTSAGLDFGIQAIQVAQGHRDGFNLSQTLEAGAGGAVAGAVLGGVTGAASHIPVGSYGAAAAVGGAAGAIGGAGGGAAAAAATGGDPAQGAAGGILGGALSGARGGLADTVPESARVDNTGAPIPIDPRQPIESIPPGGNRGYVTPDGTVIRPVHPTEHGNYDWLPHTNAAASNVEAAHPGSPDGPDDAQNVDPDFGTQHDADQALGNG